MVDLLCIYIYRGALGRPLQYRFPEGPLVQLFLAHIKEGHQLITQSGGGDAEGMGVSTLFTSNVGQSFSDVTFRNYWKGIMESAVSSGFTSQEYFAPGLLRVMFIEEFTQ
jgi:hypothetical protein